MIDSKKIADFKQPLIDGINTIKGQLKNIDPNQASQINNFLTEGLTALNNGNLKEGEKLKKKVEVFVNNLKNGN